MVTKVGAIVILVALAAAGGQPDTQKVTVSVLAVQATNEGRAARDNAPPAENKPKRSDTNSLLRQGFAPGLRNAPKPKHANNGDARYFEPGLDGIRDAVASLNFDTYKKVKSETATAAFGSETAMRITDRYTLRMTPLDKDSHGRLRVRVAVDEISLRNGDSKTMTAVETTSAIAPNKYLVIGGRLPLDEGQLVILVSAQ
ncbi:MAG: hypothetical protein HUU46_04190 [Candidatus Hydrogenedentes bacterium]|nr:hypothetical protein [Candidatus Hydrogenedentota bacterium]